MRNDDGLSKRDEKLVDYDPIMMQNEMSFQN